MDPISKHFAHRIYVDPILRLWRAQGMVLEEKPMNPELTFEELRAIKAALEIALRETNISAEYHKHCQPDAPCRTTQQAALNSTQAALDTINRELTKE